MLLIFRLTRVYDNLTDAHHGKEDTAYEPHRYMVVAEQNFVMNTHVE